MGIKGWGQQWFHVTRTWNTGEVSVEPQLIRVDEPDNSLDALPCICVAPSIPKCMVALGDWYGLGLLRVYVTEGRPRPASWVYDYKVTSEHRFYEPKVFKLVREINTQDLFDAMVDGLDLREADRFMEADCLEFLEWKLSKIEKAFRMPD